MIQNYLPLRDGVALHLKKILESPSPNNTLSQVWLKLPFCSEEEVLKSSPEPLGQFYSSGELKIIYHFNNNSCNMSLTATCFNFPIMKTLSL